MSSGYSLGVDLYELWRAGKVNIPDVAAQFNAATGPLGTARSDGGWFRSCEVGAGGVYGAGEAFGELAETLHGYLLKTHDNLISTGEAIVKAANDYHLTDTAARDEFDRRKRELPN